jgi:hypothetical protein
MLKNFQVLAAFVLLTGYFSYTASAKQDSTTGQSVEKLPPDIHPDSLSRMPRPKRSDFATEAERQTFDRVRDVAVAMAHEFGEANTGINLTEGPLGPTGTRSAIPEVAEVYKQQDIIIKKNCGLEENYMELAILVATHESKDASSFRGHSTRAMKMQLISQKTVDVIKNDQDPEGLEQKEQLIIRFGREMYRERIVSSKTFADVERTFGKRSTLGMSLLMSYYTSNALLMRVYDQH